MRKPTKNFLLLQMFKDVWSQTHDGLEYIPDGRDWRAVKEFLEFNPDILERDEVFKAAALRYMENDRYRSTEYNLNHQLYHLLNRFSTYANSITYKPKPKRQVTDPDYYCEDCQKMHKFNEVCPLLK